MDGQCVKSALKSTAKVKRGSHDRANRTVWQKSATFPRKKSIIRTFLLSQPIKYTRNVSQSDFTGRPLTPVISKANKLFKISVGDACSLKTGGIENAEWNRSAGPGSRRLLVLLIYRCKIGRPLAIDDRQSTDMRKRMSLCVVKSDSTLTFQLAKTDWINIAKAVYWCIQLYIIEFFFNFQDDHYWKSMYSSFFL